MTLECCHKGCSSLLLSTSGIRGRHVSLTFFSPTATKTNKQMIWFLRWVYLVCLYTFSLSYRSHTNLPGAATIIFHPRSYQVPLLPAYWSTFRINTVAMAMEGKINHNSVTAKLPVIRRSIMTITRRSLSYIIVQCCIGCCLDFGRNSVHTGEQ